MDSTSKHVIDGGAVTVAVASFFDWMPKIAAVLSVIWLAIRIYETPTIQKIMEKIKNAGS